MTKGSEAFERINHTICSNYNRKNLKLSLSEIDCQNLGMLIDDLDIVEMELKAFEIVVNKNVNVYTFKSALVVMDFTYREYINKYSIYHNGMEIKLLNEEEFDILKEVLECQKN